MRTRSSDLSQRWKDTMQPQENLSPKDGDEALKTEYHKLCQLRSQLASLKTDIDASIARIDETCAALKRCINDGTRT
jgi:hypothetical protein